MIPRVALAVAIAFSIALGAGTYAYLGDKLAGLSVEPDQTERGWHMRAPATGSGGVEINLASKAG